MGIYVHIPFCRSKCYYCGFYSVASTRLKDSYLKALCREMDLRKDYLSQAEAGTLYFGGGTPSYLSVDDLSVIVRKLEDNYQLKSGIERTIEMNPEDATRDKLMGLRDLGFNRLSLGVQSFNDDVLKRINRTHSAQQAILAVERAAACGFDDIGIDLIIGLPGYSAGDQERDLKIVSSLPISHISVYILSIDSDSVFERLMEKGKFQPEDDDVSAEKYLMISDHLKSLGFEHYEISNFAKNSKYSVHNTSYWQQKPYIGFGASAHSYDLVSRQWNISNVRLYIESLDDSRLNIEKEILTDIDKYNEYIMTNLRTMWGIEWGEAERLYPDYWKGARQKLSSYIEGGLVAWDDRRVRLTERGWLISDGIFCKLFV